MKSSAVPAINRMSTGRRGYLGLDRWCSIIKAADQGAAAKRRRERGRVIVPSPLRERLRSHVNALVWVRGLLRKAHFSRSEPLTRLVFVARVLSPLPQGERAQQYAPRPRPDFCATASAPPARPCRRHKKAVSQL